MNYILDASRKRMKWYHGGGYEVLAEDKHGNRILSKKNGTDAGLWMFVVKNQTLYPMVEK